MKIHNIKKGNHRFHPGIQLLTYEPVYLSSKYSDLYKNEKKKALILSILMNVTHKLATFQFSNGIFRDDFGNFFVENCACYLSWLIYA